MSTTSEVLGAFFSSLPPSPEWAPFWGSLFEGALSALSVWFFAILGFKSAFNMQLICSLSLHSAFFLIVVFFGRRDGWYKQETAECLGRIIIVALFGVYSYQYFYGRRPTQRRAVAVRSNIVYGS